MSSQFFIVVNPRWSKDPSGPGRRLAQGLLPLGAKAGHVVDGCKLLVKYRDSDGTVVADPMATIEAIGTDLYVKSEGLSRWGSQLERGLIVLLFEGTADEARCVATVWTSDEFEAVEDPDRLSMYGLPPSDHVVVDAESLTSVMYQLLADRDGDLCAAHADRFLQAPNILSALFSHVMGIRTDDSIRFPIKVKKIAEQLRAVLVDRDKEPRIQRIRKSHIDMWAEAQGDKFAFLDGGAARIGALPMLSPMALRVGIYAVRPGVDPEEGRETWTMRPYVVADLLDRDRRPASPPDRRRLQEAARYTLEALTGILYLRKTPDVRVLLTHGPLINQFTEYDEDHPHYIPFLAPEFLASVGLTKDELESRLTGLPSDTHGSMWNHFMAVYGYVLAEIHDSTVPIAGVVERATGRHVSLAIIGALEQQGVFTREYTRRVREILDDYDITDDFLFGCMLREGEYVTPVTIDKNPANRPRPRWGPVVRQYPKPAAMLLKSEETNFPFRVELNPAAVAQGDFLARFLYHTARLLPRYAFPVGLDIVDKYAKVPDWLSRGISAQISAAVMRRAMNAGDARVLTQLRLFLARGPRDFFFRPTTD